MHWITSVRGVVDCAWLIFLLLTLRYFWQKYQILQKAEYWLLASGRIVSLDWVNDQGNLWPKIKYEYQVYERNFEGEYFFLDTAFNSPNSKYARNLAYKAAMAFQGETAIDVYYNPNNPLESALDVRIPNKLKFTILSIIGLLAYHLATIGYYLWWS